MASSANTYISSELERWMGSRVSSRQCIGRTRTRPSDSSMCRQTIDEALIQLPGNRRVAKAGRVEQLRGAGPRHGGHRNYRHPARTTRRAAADAEGQTVSSARHHWEAGRVGDSMQWCPTDVPPRLEPVRRVPLCSAVKSSVVIP